MRVPFLSLSPGRAFIGLHATRNPHLKNEYRIKISRLSPNRIFMFQINPPSGNVRIQKLIAKHIFERFEKRKGEDGKVNTYSMTFKSSCIYLLNLI